MLKTVIINNLIRKEKTSFYLLRKTNSSHHQYIHFHDNHYRHP